MTNNYKIVLIFKSVDWDSGIHCTDIKTLLGKKR